MGFILFSLTRSRFKCLRIVLNWIDHYVGTFKILYKTWVSTQSTYTIGTLSSAASLLASTFYEWTHEIMIGTTSSGMSYQLRDIYSIYRCYWIVATYKCNVDNGKIKIVSFVVLKRPQLSVFRCMSRYTSDVAVPVISIFSSSMGKMHQHTIHFFLFIEKSMHEVCSKQIMEQIVRRGAHVIPIGIPTVCWKIRPPNITNMLSIKTFRELFVGNTVVRNRVLQYVISYLCYIVVCLWNE